MRGLLSNSSCLLKAEPGKLDIKRCLLSDSTSVLKAEPGKLDFKRREPGILFISLPYCFSDYDVIFDFCVDSASSATSFKECNVIMT